MPHAFSTYASMRVRGAMIDHLRRHASLSRSAMTKRREMLKAKTEFEKTMAYVGCRTVSELSMDVFSKNSLRALGYIS